MTSPVIFNENHVSGFFFFKQCYLPTSNHMIAISISSLHNFKLYRILRILSYFVWHLTMLRCLFTQNTFLHLNIAEGMEENAGVMRHVFELFLT